MRLLCRGCLLLGAPAVPPWVLRLAALKGATPPSPHTPRGDGAIHVALRAGGDVERVQTLLRDHGLVGFDVRGRGPASAGTDECSSFSSSFSSFSSSPPLPRAAMLLRHSSVLLALFTPHHAPRPLSPPAIINLSLGWWPSVGVSRRSTGADWKIGQHPRVRPRDRRGIGGGGGGGGGAAGWWWSWAGGKSTGPGRGRAKRGRGGGNIRYLLPMIFRADLAAPARRMASSWDRAGTGSQRGPKQPPRGAPSTAQATPKRRPIQALGVPRQDALLRFLSHRRPRESAGAGVRQLHLQGHAGPAGRPLRGGSTQADQARWRR